MDFLDEILAGLERNEPFYSREDILSIAKEVGRENEEDFLSEIEFEFSSADQSVFSNIYVVLNERYAEGKDLSDFSKVRDAVALSAKVESLSKHICEVYEDKDLSSLYEEGFPAQELVKFFDQLEVLKDRLNDFLLSPNQRIKRILKKGDHYERTYAGYTKWGKNSRYNLLIESAARFYERASGKNFKCAFEYNTPNDPYGGGLTPGIKFIRPFHTVVNKIAVACTCEPFSDGTFATACKEAQKKLKLERVNQNH